MNRNRSCARNYATTVTLLAAAIFVLFAGAGGQVGAAGKSDPWREIEDGLLLGEFDSEPTPGAGAGKILIVRVNPRKFAFRLMAASEYANRKWSVKEWCERYQLLGAFNAGMYAKDGVTSVGFMKNFRHVNNGRLNKYNAVLAFNPLDAGVPEIQIIDRECQDFASLKGKYQTFVQSIRMVSSCDQQNVWSQQPRGWSTLAIGLDKNSNVLVIFCQPQIPVHDLIDTLLTLPISLHNAMYLEGGPQASLYLTTPKTTIERHGSWEATADGHNSIQVSLPVPNVIGIVRKP